MAGSSSACIESAFIEIHVGRSTTIASGESGGVGRREVSATGPYAARAAPDRLHFGGGLVGPIAGPAGTRRPVVLANSQSTYPAMASSRWQVDQ